MRNLLIVSLIGLPFGIAIAAERPDLPVNESQEKLVLFDFEKETEFQTWRHLDLLKASEPRPRIEQTTENATSGSGCLKVTFDGGTWPTVISSQVPGDWSEWHTFQADVIAPRQCVVGFCVMQEGSTRDSGWDGGVSRWARTQFLQPGRNTISGNLHPNEWSALRTTLENGRILGKVVSLEFFVYRPHQGEAFFIDNIRILKAKVTPAAENVQKFKVLGTDLAVSGVQELGKKFIDKWAMPEPQTVEQVESRFKADYEKLKLTHPHAILAILRDGEAGFDRTDPDKVFAGWQDAYWSSHGPDSLNVDRSSNFGSAATQELFMRHRSPLMRVDLSSIPVGSRILAAKLLVVRSGDPAKEHSPLKPNMWVAEACRRPWTENEVDAYRYAKDKHWKAIGGMSWEGNDPDFWPIYVAHGPSQPICSTWEFVDAIRFWTDGNHENHGFMLHGDSKDWFRAWFREAPVLKNRPAVLVVYEPLR